MTTKDTSEPAFPAPDAGESDYGANNRGAYRGMTLRDYFAASAMRGFNKLMVDYGWDKKVLAGHAKQAYAIADAMLEARK